MSPRKLTAADKKAIVSTYRSSQDSAMILADRYGVSSSTISRLLRTNIPENEYETLISEKRGQKGGEIEEAIASELLVVADPVSDANEADLATDDFDDSSQSSDTPRLRATASRRVRRRSSAPESEELEKAKPSVPKPVTKSQKYSPESELDIDSELEIVNRSTSFDRPTISLPMPQASSSPASAREFEDATDDLSAVASLFGEDMGDLLEDDDDDLPEEDGWADGSIPALVAPEVPVLPFSEASLPRTCYIVVDKFAELVACPLRDFVEVGNQAKTDVDAAPQNTLPVFDSQRVAKRFSNNRNQRVIKVPDSSVFQKTITHLLAKGISLLLVDGQIYSLR
jgi:hypothetical protein